MIIDGELYAHHDRDAFKLLIVAACVVYAAAALLFYDRLGSPSLKAFPTPVAMAFLTALLVFSAISMAGVVTGNGRLEGHGMLGLSGIWLCFAVMGVSTSGHRATAFSSFLLAFALAAAWTWWQKIGRPWRSARTGLREARDVE